MHIDLKTACPSKLTADVAVIGSGAAGQTMTKALLDAGLSVILIESGGLDYEKETAALNGGANVGQPYYDLEGARLRFFGGTTAIWGGRCAELNPIDFERRSWVPHSGWPIDINDVRPWYSKARRMLEVGEDASESQGAVNFPFDGLSVRYWAFDRRFDRFGHVASRAFFTNARAMVLLHATVREILPTASGKAVERLDVRGPGGERLVVEARTLVLAAGGLENARILLASDSVCKNGLGNDHDLVGRFFMEHPHARGGRIVNAASWRLLNAFRRRRTNGVERAALLTPSADLQRSEGLLNSAMSLAVRPPEGGSASSIQRLYVHARHAIEPTSAGRGLWKAYRRGDGLIKQTTGALTPWFKLQRGKRELAIVIRAEQSPNPDSRVTLDKETDSTGMRRIRLDWRLQPIDIYTASRMVDALGRELTKHKLGEVEKAGWLCGETTTWVTDPVVSSHPIGGYHHMGTTRMAEDPRQGVTDQWGRVHGIANLYVAGSSLFPSSGWANPTLTIIALSLRTADRIIRVLAEEPDRQTVVTSKRTFPSTITRAYS